MTDSRPEPAPAARTEDAATGATEPAPIAFTGKASDFFEIWCVNIALTVVTLGVYSAWAKVRQTRYFLGHTIVLGDRLEYHATGPAILKGRLIAVAAVAGLAALGAVSETAQAAAALALLPVYPWVLNRALRFRARNTSWRTVRFDWRGDYWGTAKVYLLWPLAAVATVGLLAPMAARAQREYLASNHTLGRERFLASTPLGPYYRALLRTIAYGAILFALLAGLTVAIGALVRDLGGTLLLQSYIVAAILAVTAAYSLCVLYFRILVRNIVVNALTLGRAAEFRADLDPLHYQRIVVSNFFATVFSLFLMYPWARIRVWRYQAEHIAVRPLVDDAVFADTEARSGHAFGEEFGEIEGVEIGL